MKNEKMIYNTIVGGLLLGALIVGLFKFHARSAHKDDASETAAPSAVSKTQGGALWGTSAQAAVPRSFPAAPQDTAGAMGRLIGKNDDEDGDVDEEASARQQALALAEQFRKPLNVTEVKSVKTFVQKMQKYTAAGFTPEMAFADLKKMGLQPVMAKASDPDTGTLITIRTESSLPGMRYIHLQYVTDDKGVPHLQSMTGEARPGTDSMDVAKNAIHTQFGVRGAPASERADFAEWHRDPYTAWVKQLNTEEELVGDPFNARTVEDAGTVSIGYEINPHMHDAEDHDHF